jgi:hypothetical protein
MDECLATLALLPRVRALAKTVRAMDIINVLLIQVPYCLEQITDDDSTI